MEDGDSEKDTMKILIATDNHLGYLEKDPVRGNDSFLAFEEILKLAKQLKVDFILLGGDLFHENKPSRSTLYKTMELLRKYCFGDRPVNIEILSDQSINFHNRFGTVNYEDPNFNIEIPVFSIHGNHDDPAGEGGLAALDLLSVTNLVNYFGKSENIDDVTVYPILMRKGNTKLALYGLGNIRDERLYRTFQQKKVKLMRPVEGRDNWFNLLVLHQNRVAHSPKNYIHECMLDNFLDFVVWGHEHECLINPEPSGVGEYFITQPGSSVATALSEGESKKKHVGLLFVCGDNFLMRPIPLNSVRPFVMDEIVLSSESNLKPEDSDEAVVEILAAKVEEMIAKAIAEAPKDAKAPVKPLVRLKVEYSGGFRTTNPQRFGQRFVGKVANPNEILLFHRRRTTSSSTSKKNHKELEKDLLMRALRPEPLDSVKIEDLIEGYLGDPSNGLEILPESELHLALHHFVEKDDKSAISDFVSKTLTSTQNYLKKEDPQKTLQPDFIHNIVSEWTAVKRVESSDGKPRLILKDEPSDDAYGGEEGEAMDYEEEEEEEEESPPKKASKSAKSAKAAPKKPTKKAEVTKKPAAKKVTKKSEKQDEPASKKAPTKSSAKGKKSTYSLEFETGHAEPVIVADDSEDEAPPPKKVKAEPQQTESKPKKRITSLSDVLAPPDSQKPKIASIVQQVDEDALPQDGGNHLEVSKKWGKRKLK